MSRRQQLEDWLQLVVVVTVKAKQWQTTVNNQLLSNSADAPEFKSKLYFYDDDEMQQLTHLNKSVWNTLWLFPMLGKLSQTKVCVCSCYIFLFGVPGCSNTCVQRQLAYAVTTKCASSGSRNEWRMRTTKFENLYSLHFQKPALCPPIGCGMVMESGEDVWHNGRGV